MENAKHSSVERVVDGASKDRRKQFSIGSSSSHELLVGRAFVLHQQDADRADAHPATGKRGLLDEDQDIQRVVVAAPCPDDEPVVTRIMHG
jgi:hypothetical protein